MKQTWYTVVGVYTENWQKFCEHVLATSPREAESIIYSDPKIDDDLVVAAVFEGRLNAVDEWEINRPCISAFRPTLAMCWLHDRVATAPEQQ
jgi:hypothetical protein